MTGTWAKPSQTLVLLHSIKYFIKCSMYYNIFRHLFSVGWLWLRVLRQSSQRQWIAVSTIEPVIRQLRLLPWLRGALNWFGNPLRGLPCFRPFKPTAPNQIAITKYSWNPIDLYSYFTKFRYWETLYVINYL